MEYFKRLMKCFALVGIILAGWANIAEAQQSARNEILKMSEQIQIKLAQGSQAEANDLFLKRFDMDKFGKRCLKDHWESLTVQEKQRFVALLFKNLQKTAREKNFFARDKKVFQLIPGEESKSDGIVLVKSTLKTSKKDLKLKLYLKANSNDFEIVDYELEGALLSRNYRGHFNYLMRKYGKDGFFEKLENKLSKESA